jgi:hypothetical protein
MSEFNICQEIYQVKKQFSIIKLTHCQIDFRNKIEREVIQESNMAI